MILDTQPQTTTNRTAPSRSSTGHSQRSSSSTGSDSETLAEKSRSSNDHLDPSTANTRSRPHVNPRTSSAEAKHRSFDPDAAARWVHDLPPLPVSRSDSPLPHSRHGSPKSFHQNLEVKGEKKHGSKESGQSYSPPLPPPPPSYHGRTEGQGQPHYQKQGFGPSRPPLWRKSSDGASVHTTGSVMTGAGGHRDRKWRDSEIASVYPASTIVGSEKRKSVVSFTSVYTTASDQIPFGGRFSRASLNKAMGEDGASHGAEATSIPCAGVRIRHGPLKGLIGWRLVVKPPNASATAHAVLCNFIFDTSSRHSFISPQILECLGYNGFNLGDRIKLAVQGLVIDFVVTEEDEASVLSLDFLIAGGLSLFIDQTLDAPVVYVEQKGLPKDVPKTAVEVVRRRTINKIKSFFGIPNDEA